MIRLRAEKIERIADDIPEQEVEGDRKGDVLLVLAGEAPMARSRARSRSLREKRTRGLPGALRYLNPFPRNLGAISSAASSMC